MPNPQQNKMQNKTEQIKEEINLLQDRLNRNKKSLNQFQNGLMQIKRIQVKKARFFSNQKIQNIVKNMFQNRANKKTQIYYKIYFHKLKKERDYLKKGLKKVAKMQNLSQNELNQITKMCDQSWDGLEQIAKIRRIKNYEEMSKEELIISLLKSKQSIAKLFHNNLDDDKISDIKKILSKLTDILPII